jgi:hypothetical protein
VVTYLHGLELTSDGKARLRGTAALAGYPSGAVRQGGSAWAVTSDWTGGTTVTGLAAFEQFARTQGWVQDIVVGPGVAYLPSGPHGVPMVELEP